jgi:anti-sigma B factor antagonist
LGTGAGEALVVMSSDYLKVRLERYEQVCVLAASGEMDIGSSATFTEFVEGVAAAMKPRPSRVILDLSGLRFIDCSGARALGAVARSAPGRPPVIVRSVRPPVRRVLDLMGLDLDLLGPSLDLMGLDLNPRAEVAAVAGSQTGILVRQLQLARSHAEKAIADSRQAAQSLAATEDRIAATLTQLAVRRPKESGRLTALSQTAREQAIRMRDQARHALPHQTA